MDKKLKIGTRGSPLALAQAYEVRDRLLAQTGGAADDIDICVIRTMGDQILDRALSEAGGKGLFTTEIEKALSEGEIDLAVHSAKDMPTELPEGLVLAAFLPREDVRDAWLSRDSVSLDELAEGAVVGTASLRRGAQIKKRRPDLSIVTFRGTVQTRLEKLARGEVQATLLAVAGLKRLGLPHLARQALPAESFLPALGQGAITIEARADDARIVPLLAAIDHAPTHQALLCERACLRVLDGSCRTPIAGLAQLTGDELTFRAEVLKPDGSDYKEVALSGKAADAAALGGAAGADLLNQIGGDLEAWLGG